MDSISLKALAKINLALDVTGVREDGYHDVRMIMQSVKLFDRVEIKKMRSGNIRVDTALYYLPNDESNLAYRAAKLMKEAYQIKDGVRISLQKYIPIAAGLGGGSSDAAAVLVGMNKLFKIGATQEELCALGLKAGADVPFCIMRGTALAEGVGEILTPLPQMIKCPVLIVKPQVPVSTQDTYRNLKLVPGMAHPDIDQVIEGIREKDLDKIAANTGNVLETVTIPRNPIIGEIKKMMTEQGAAVSLMSGSGPSVFGLFRTEEELYAAYTAMKASEYAKNINVYSTEIHNNRR